MIKQVSIHRLNGVAVFQLGTSTFESTFEIEYTSAKALIKFTKDLNIFPLASGLIFNGYTNEGVVISGEVNSNNYNITNYVVIADLTYLHIGNEGLLDDIQEIKSKLLGVYFPHDISFQHEKYFIEFRKSEWSIDEAQRTKEATGAILDGNEIVIKGDKLNKTEVEQLFIDICFLLRPICSSEIYFGHYVCNNNLIIFPKNIFIKGTLFGMQENLLNNTIIWKDLFSNGLSSYKKLEALQRQEYINIGYALSMSAGCGTMETAISNLIQTIEFIGNNTTVEGIQQSNKEIKNQVKTIKSHLSQSLECFNNLNLDENILQGIKNSVGRIQPWNPEVIKKFKSLLTSNGWNIDIDFEEFKLIRDELAHTGLFPKDFPYDRRYKIREQLEVILLICAMDLIGIEGRISRRDKNGWVVYPQKSEIKKP